MNTFFKNLFKGSMAKINDFFANPRVMSLLMMIFCFGLNMFAAGEGGGAITGVTTEITGYIPAVKNLIYAIAAVVALIGAFSIYNKMVNGDQDVKKSIMLTLGGCIALVALATALPGFFGY